MKKRLCFICCVLLLVSLIAGCGSVIGNGITGIGIPSNNPSTQSDPLPTGTTAPIHMHSFADATCTAPRTCTGCGMTAGEAAGHSWRSATCSAPKTCTVCGITEGTTAAHSYTMGTCTACGASDPNYTSSGILVWIPESGKKYHSKENCSNMEDPKQVTLEEAVLLGYTPCKRCH